MLARIDSGAALIEQFKDASCVGMLDEVQRENLHLRPTKPVPAELWRKFGYSPNAWAMVHLHTSNARFNAVCTCRQCGKTEAISMEIADAMTAPPKRGDELAIWNDCDSPDDEGACTHFDALDPASAPKHDGALIYAKANYVGVVSFDLEHAAKSIARYLFHVHVALGEKAYKLNKNEKSLTLVGSGAVLRWFSSKNVESTQGETFTYVLFDEAQNIPDAVWDNTRPALDVRMAGVLATGTPDPKPNCTWFKGLFLKGEETDEADYYSYTLPAWENRWMTVETIAQAREDMSETEFRKKYLGQWVDDDTAVFRNVDANFTGRLYPDGPQSDAALKDGLKGPYIIGLDVARAADYTVAYVVEAKTQRVVDRFRMNHLNFERAADAVEALYHKWSVRGVHIDMTAMGYGLYEILKKRGLTVWGAEFTADFKSKLVATAVREIEKAKCILPAEDRNLRRELKAFTRVVTPAGNIRYTAPSNYNDDCVAALGLALLKANRVGKLKSSSYI